MQFLPEIRRIMCSVMAVAPDSIGPHTQPNDLPAWDSLSHLNLVVAMEDELGIRLSAAEIERMTSVSAICAIVAGKRGA